MRRSEYNSSEIKDGKTMKFPIKCMLWITCGLLYFMMCAPIIYRIANFAETDTTFIIGLCIMVFGIAFEGIADLQKNKAKKKNPNRFVDTGLYKIVRHPMYISTILLFLSMPLILGSIISFVIFLAYPFIISRRIKNEEEVLEKELAGYIEYKKKVKYKLIPFIW